MGESHGAACRALSRRDVLKVSALGAAALALPFERRCAREDRVQDLREEDPEALHPALHGSAGDRRPGRGHADHHAEDGQRRDPPGRSRPRSSATTASRPDRPSWRRRGTPLNVTVRNELPAKHPNWGYEAWTSTHLHGSASKPQYDGYASDITRVGQTKTYQFPNNQESRTLWYHDHGVHHTAENAYMGLAAMYLHERRARGPAADPEGRLRPAGRDRGQDVRRQRQPHVRRRGPLRPLRRRDAGQRPALAEPEGRASASTASGSSTPPCPAACACS